MQWQLFVLLAVSALIYLGLLERVLERLRLDSKKAILILLLLILANFIPDIPIYRGLSLDLSGGLIPLALIIYLISRAERPQEKIRTVITIIIVATVVIISDKTMSLEPGHYTYDLDPLYIPAVLAAVVAYLFGRSRRAAFCGAAGGVIVLDLAAWIENIIRVPDNIPVVIGGGGIFAATIFSGVLAVLLAETVGEIRERWARRSIK